MRDQTKLGALIEQFKGQALDAHYLGYFECFNQRRFFEAHEVLEVLWLQQRTGPEGLFYKGLIQLAGAFVHLQKNRPKPAASLFRLARQNLQNYTPNHQHLEVSGVLATIDSWLEALSGTPGLMRFESEHAPVLVLGQRAFVLPQ